MVMLKNVGTDNLLNIVYNTKILFCVNFVHLVLLKSVKNYIKLSIHAKLINVYKPLFTI